MKLSAGSLPQGFPLSYEQLKALRGQMPGAVVAEAGLAALVPGRGPIWSRQPLLWPLPPGLYVLAGAGALMMAVGFLGCCGATRESQCVLGSFFTCLLVIFAAEITTGVFAFIGKDVAIRHVQTMYEEAYNDYLRDREKGNGTLITFHSTNCIDEIERIISVKLQLIGIVGIGIAALTIFGMIFSMVLCCAIRNSRDVI
ncbi:tetraspanin-2 isoform X3 [Tursiops truncatus]|uniref:tetraspanin-2 isoform X3 n=1 Tax=Tursiops truncatus TaxID=9739 RepID=UPI003CCF482A